jgi:uncharacterized protein RhaS with RHS repeats
MANQTASPGQIIDLPRGGGAIQGIGEKFEPDLFTGTGNFAIPIAVPPGRNGFQPQLTLGYSSGNGNGPFGIGWSLSIPWIARKTSKGVPIYDPTDTFLLSGSEDLVPVAGAPANATRYRPRTEGSFAHIDHYADGATNDYWQVRSKDGLVSIYGTPEMAGSDPAVVGSPSNRRQVAAWKLTQTHDPFQNRIAYQYLRDTANLTPHHWDQLYPRQIQYIDYTAADGSQAYLASVFFEYGETMPGDMSTIPQRQDAFSEYRTGFEIRTRWRCSKITVFTNAGAQMPVRSYSLNYGQDAYNGFSLLQIIQVIGYDDAGNPLQELPPLEFFYNGFAPGERRFFPITGPGLPASSLADPAFELVDLEGNGLPSVLEMNGAVRTWSNVGNAGLGLPKPMKLAPAGLRLSDPGVQILDADGDGRADLMVTTPTIGGYFPLDFAGGWDRGHFTRFKALPTFDLKDPQVRLVDLNGDGVTDAIRSSTRLEFYFNDPSTGWSRDPRWNHAPLSELPSVDFSNPHVQLADMTGDGLQDIVLLHDGLVEYWPNLGWGAWGARVRMSNSPRLPLNYDPKRILLGDVNGDGLSDFVYVESGKVTLYINNSGGGWSAPIEITGTPPASNLDAVRLVDFLGSGTCGILWSANADGTGRPNLYFLDFTGGVKPFLLGSVDNHRGALTSIEYASSTQYFLADEISPVTSWKTRLPFPVQVVAKVVSIDYISVARLTTEYSYHHGYWDGVEREFRGFGRVDHRDTEVIQGQPAFYDTTPVETRTWFHQGAIGDGFSGWTDTDYSPEFWAGDAPALTRPQSVVNFLANLPPHDRRDALRALRGSVLRTEVYAHDGSARADRPYLVTEQQFGVEEVDTPAAGTHRIYFPYRLSQRNSKWERGSDPLTRFTFTADFDAYGQARTQVNLAVPRGLNFRAPSTPSQPYLITQSRTTFAQRDDATLFAVDRVSSVSNYEVLAADQVSGGAIAAVVDLAASIVAASPNTANIIAQTLNYFDGPAFVGSNLGQLGNYGALVRTEELVLTQAQLTQIFPTGEPIPPYLVAPGPPQWPAGGYPTDFEPAVPALAGYVVHRAGDPGVPGYYTAPTRRQYDFQTSNSGKGLVTVQRDPLGHDTSITYDAPYSCLPISVTDPAGNTTIAEYKKYRVFQPSKITDPNGNHQLFTFTASGLLENVIVTGKDSENLGDTPVAPGTAYTYNFTAFIPGRKPVSVQTVRRIYHINDTDVLPAQRDQTITTVEYSDGFGRLVQTRTQAEDVLFGDPVFGAGVIPPDQSTAPGDTVGRQRGPTDPVNVIVSGWQVYNNKGHVVLKYEPFFSTGFAFAPLAAAPPGENITLLYDPLGRLIRTVNPDQSEQRVVLGVPGTIASPNLTTPDNYEPTPWETYTYDADDNAGRTHPTSSTTYQSCWDTPASSVIDALGRAVRTTQRNRAHNSDGTWSAIQEYSTKSVYDIRGNVVSVVDPMNRTAFQYAYDLANRAWRTQSIDAGVNRTVFDASGNVIERRDSKGSLSVGAFDALNRPTHLWARDLQTEDFNLRGLIVYGDDRTSGQSAATNALGRPYQHYDEAGLLTFSNYDFKGNLTAKTRRVFSQATLSKPFAQPPAGWNLQPFRADWSTIDLTLLDPAQYTTTATFDALNRPKTLDYPSDVGNARKQLVPVYNEAGLLKSVQFDGTPYVQQIAYDAKGRRTLIAYGNNVMTRYAYDPWTFRLLRMRSEAYVSPLPAPLTYRPANAAQPVQDFGYAYDPVGNILAIHDRIPNCGIPNSPAGVNALDRAFVYDPIYRLVSATGRECAASPSPLPWDPTFRCSDATLTRPCTETYAYDATGNIATWTHTQIAADGTANTTNKQFTLAAANNQLASVAIGATSYTYAYDAAGNILQENTERHFEWDYANRMRVFRNQTAGAEPTAYAQYAYDFAGERVLKFVRNPGGQLELTVYIDGVFEYQRLVTPAQTLENNTLHVMDDKRRIATVRVGAPFRDDGTATVPIKYQLADHLGSSNVVLDPVGALVNREEYLPYGDTSFGSYARKRYRFTGKERDAESGLYYHGARYYAPVAGKMGELRSTTYEN